MDRRKSAVTGNSKRSPRIKRVEKKATPARQGKNPRTGEPMTIPAKPKRTVVKALALKGLKEMVK